MLALIVVTFLHLVVGEMAPKSWAIAHPERSAILLALPMRGVHGLTRPLLVALNGMANWCLRRVGVQPVDEVGAGRNPDDLRELVDHSAKAGALDPERRDQLVTALELDTAPLRRDRPSRLRGRGVAARRRRRADPRRRPRRPATCGWSCATEPSRSAWCTCATRSTAAPGRPPRATSCGRC